MAKPFGLLTPEEYDQAQRKFTGAQYLGAVPFIGGWLSQNALRGFLLDLGMNGAMPPSAYKRFCNNTAVDSMVSTSVQAASVGLAGVMEKLGAGFGLAVSNLKAADSALATIDNLNVDSISIGSVTFFKVETDNQAAMALRNKNKGAWSSITKGLPAGKLTNSVKHSFLMDAIDLSSDGEWNVGPWQVALAIVPGLKNICSGWRQNPENLQGRINDDLTHQTDQDHGTGDGGGDSRTNQPPPDQDDHADPAEDPSGSRPDSQGDGSGIDGGEAPHGMSHEQGDDDHGQSDGLSDSPASTNSGSADRDSQGDNEEDDDDTSDPNDDSGDEDQDSYQQSGDNQENEGGAEDQDTDGMEESGDPDGDTDFNTDIVMLEDHMEDGPYQVLEFGGTHVDFSQKNQGDERSDSSDQSSNQESQNEQDDKQNPEKQSDNLDDVCEDLDGESRMGDDHDTDEDGTGSGDDDDNLDDLNAPSHGSESTPDGDTQCLEPKRPGEDDHSDSSGGGDSGGSDIPD